MNYYKRLMRQASALGTGIRELEDKLAEANRDLDGLVEKLDALHNERCPYCDDSVYHPEAQCPTCGATYTVVDDDNGRGPSGELEWSKGNLLSSTNDDVPSTGT